MRDTAASTVFTLAELIAPEVGEIGWGDGNVRINHPYLRRVAKLAQSGQLAVGFIHSYPRRLPPRPSKVDEEMDPYLADNLGSLLTARTFASLNRKHLCMGYGLVDRDIADGSYDCIK